MSSLPFQERQPRVIQRISDATTNPAQGSLPQNRPIEKALKLSFLNINKPAGPTSHQVAEYVKNIVGVSKAGHGGTLDPGVTGVLPVALQDAVKVVRSFLLAGKEYVCFMRMHKEVTRAQLDAAIAAHTGAIRQLPPLKSAVKREWRTRTVYYIDVLEHDGTDVLMRVGCEAGTYIRKLCTDIGDNLGCGAHMQQLLRTQSATFSWHNAVTLQDVADAMAYYTQGDETFLRKILVPVEEAVAHLPALWMTDSAVASVSLGAKLHVPGVVRYHSDIKKNMLVALYSLKGELVALGLSEMDSAHIPKQKSGVVARLERVVMAPGTYTA